MALSELSSVMQRPMSVSQLVNVASEEFFDPWYPPRSWFRTAEHMFKQGNVYLHENNLQPAFFILYRHAILISNELAKHPQAKDQDYKRSWTSAYRDAEKSLEVLEELKPKINRNYEKYLLKRKEAKEKAKREKRTEEESLDSLRDGFGSGNMLDPVEHSEFGVRMVNARTSRRSRRIEKRHDGETDGEDLGSMMRQTRMQIDRNAAAISSDPISPHSSRFYYPSVQHREDRAPSNDGFYHHEPPPSSFESTASNASAIHAPPIPPKQLENFISPARPPKSPGSPPSLPREPYTTSNSTPTRPPKVMAPSRSSTPAPALEQFRTTSTLESGSPLRTLFLPTELRHSFLSLAAKNTARNLETLGLLCGQLMRNALFITTLLLPPQKSTSDTCEMTEVGEVMVDEYISANGAPDPEPSNSDEEDDIGGGRKKVRDEYATSMGGDMIILGWIHTHPTQTCFLSSRDLHTHVWYQSGLPESIALVCAPSKRAGLGSEWNAFRLTDPPGMKTVRECKRSGIFHPHEDVGAGIYTNVVGQEDAGHVREVQDLKFEVVDLREEL